MQNCGRIDQAASYRWVAWTPALSEAALADYSVPLAFARKLARSDSNEIADQTALGALLYRAGNYAEAATELRAAEQHFLSNPREDIKAVYPRLFLAMAEWRLGHADEARAIWEKTQDGLKTALISSGRWYDRATLEILRDEAVALLQIPDAQQDGADR